MCGRFSIITETRELEKRFRAIAQQPLWPHFNAAPTQQLPIITSAQPNVIQLARWGLRPSWWRLKSGLINARAEGLRDQATFRDAWRQRRCLILADGFYEWQKDGHRLPFRFTLPDENPFALAGIWEPFTDGTGQITPSFAIITTNANDTVSAIHNRMPVILQPDEESIWLNPKISPEKELTLLRSYPGPMKSYSVSPKINSVKYDKPDSIKPSSKS
jgi:putative SOS response-associated peptidase YedK